MDLPGADSNGSFSTLKHLIRLDSERDLFKSYLSDTKNISETVLKLKERSTAAIKDFVELRKIMSAHRSVSVLIQRIR